MMIAVSERLWITVEHEGVRARAAAGLNVASWVDTASGHLGTDLEDDAADAVSDVALALLGQLGLPVPTCPEHDDALGVCGSTWYCGAGGHDLTVLGSLRI